MHYHITRPADTHATQFSVGAASFTAGSGHLLTTQPKVTVFQLQNVCPISRTAAHVNEQWNRFISDKWDIVQRYIDSKYPDQDITKCNIWMKCEKIKGLNDYIRDITNGYCWVRSEWLQTVELRIAK